MKNTRWKSPGGTFRPFALSIAGYDPCGGAGLLADIKTFEQHKVYGLGIVSALTFQTENDFYFLKWLDEKGMLEQLKTYLNHYPVSVVKFGLAPSWKTLNKLVERIKTHNEKIKIIVDPILKSSTGFGLLNKHDKKILTSLLFKIDLLTPNYEEAAILTSVPDGMKAGKQLSQYCNILLKGGHNKARKGTDYLFTRNTIHEIKPGSATVYAKHGSGCVLSAAITANLALGMELKESCIRAKHYTERFLGSNKSLLGYHA